MISVSCLEKTTRFGEKGIFFLNPEINERMTRVGSRMTRVGSRMTRVGSFFNSNQLVVFVLDWTKKADSFVQIYTP